MKEEFEIFNYYKQAQENSKKEENILFSTTCSNEKFVAVLTKLETLIMLMKIIDNYKIKNIKIEYEKSV